MGAEPHSEALEGKPRCRDERTAPGLRWYVILGGINRRLATLLEADAFAFPPPPITGVGTSGLSSGCRLYSTSSSLYDNPEPA